MLAVVIFFMYLATNSNHIILSISISLPPSFSSVIHATTYFHTPQRRITLWYHELRASQKGDYTTRCRTILQTASLVISIPTFPKRKRKKEINAINRLCLNSRHVNKFCGMIWKIEKTPLQKERLRGILSVVVSAKRQQSVKWCLVGGRNEENVHDQANHHDDHSVYR